MFVATTDCSLDDNTRLADNLCMFGRKMCVWMRGGSDVIVDSHNSIAQTFFNSVSSCIISSSYEVKASYIVSELTRHTERHEHGNDAHACTTRCACFSIESSGIEMTIACVALWML